MGVLNIVLKVFLLIIFGYINWRLFYVINRVKITQNATRSLKSKKNTSYSPRTPSSIVFFIINLTLIVLIFVFFPFGYQSDFYTSSYSIFLIYFVLVLLPLFSIAYFTKEAKISFQALLKTLSYKYIFYLLPV